MMLDPTKDTLQTRKAVRAASPALEPSETASETQPYRIVLRCRTKRTEDDSGHRVSTAPTEEVT